MRPILIVSGVLGLGTALVFAVAATAATLFPTGTFVPSGWNGGWAQPGMRGGPVFFDDGKDGVDIFTGPDGQPLPMPEPDVQLIPPGAGTDGVVLR